MTALLLTLAVFAVFWLIGLAVLAALRAETSELRVVLTAPVVGTAVVVLPLFTLSYAGVSMGDAAWPVSIGLVAGSAAIVVWRRPRVPRMTLVVIALCLVNLALLGRPMADFGFDWVGNGNMDMAAYTLSATQLIDHGLLGPTNLEALAENRSYATMTQAAHENGARPGADITLAALAVLTDQSPYQVFMPLILALSMCLICAVGALAMLAAPKPWAAAVGAGLLALAPFAGFGVLQQLLPQTWGLAMAAALFAWLMRPEIHRAPGPTRAELAVISLLVATFVLVYSELAALLVLAYALFLVILLVQRRLQFRPVLRLLGVPVLVFLVVHNFYFLRELEYIVQQAANGTAAGGGTTGGEVPLFGYTLVPAALPGVFGLQLLPASPAAALLEISIVVAIIALVFVVVLLIVTARRAVAASVVLLALLGFGLVLALQQSDFGLYKIFMYIQPFLAAAIAVWVSSIRRIPVLAAAAVLLAVGVGIQVRHANAYVDASRDPIDLHNGSSPYLVPYFREVFAWAREPVISVTENPTLTALEAMVARDRPLHFIARSRFFGPHNGGWTTRAFNMLRSEKPRSNTFQINELASVHMSSDRCLLILPTGTQSILNRIRMPEGSRDLQARRCDKYPQNTLVFIPSTLGESFYLPRNRRNVSAYQLEPDRAYPGRTFAGFGRYALLRVLNPSQSVRLVLDLTTTFRQDGVSELPPAAVIGTTRVEMPMLGRGSARVVSPPVEPQIVDGVAYLLLDMGRDGQLIDYPRNRITGLWGRNVPLDGRHLTSWVRGVSLMSESQYERMAPPRAVGEFDDGGLADHRVEYSGIFEDGWVGQHAYAELGSGPAGTFALRADVPPRPGGQHLEVRIDGRTAYSRPTPAGVVTVRVPLPASERRRRVELRWAGEVRLRLPDRRLAAARLQYLGMAPPPAVVRIPRDLDQIGFSYAGIYRDGWSEKTARARLRGGGPANLVIQAQVPLPGQRLRVLVNGRQVASQQVAPGRLDLRVPLPLSPGPRRVEVRWAVIAPISAEDPRVAAARFTLLAVPPPPVQVRTEDLGDPALVASGVSTDGWLERRSSLLLRGGPAASLVIRALVPEEVRGQRLVIRLDGQGLASIPVTPGELEFRSPLPPAAVGRRLELLWAKDVALERPDTRRASARLLFASVAPARSASIVRPQDLADPRLAYSGIYRDGWMERRVRLLLAGGRAAHLRLNTQVVLPGQQLTVLLGGRTIAVQRVRRGDSETRVLMPASTGLRDVELRWAKAAPLAANDRRPAAALLRSAAVEPVKTPLRIGAGDLDDPRLGYSGAYEDGWLQRRARFMLAGGPTAGLTVRAQIVVLGQRLRVLVDGRTVAAQAVPPGPMVVRVPIPPSGRARSVELEWAREAPLAPNDRRPAAARLREISIVAARAPQRVALGELDDSDLLHAGIYGDGWMERDARFALAGGPAGTLTLRAQVVVPAQALQVVVGSRVVASQAVGQGEVVVTAPIPASVGPRFVELRWAKAARLAPNDARAAAARLRSLGITLGTPTPTPTPTETTLQARLSVSANVPPAVTPPADARGTFTATLNGRTLRWRLVVSGVSGPVVAAVIRGGGAAERGPRLVELCAPCSTSASGVVELTAAQVAQLTNAAAYVNVGTAVNPDGEIRGQIVRR